MLVTCPSLNCDYVQLVPCFPFFSFAVPLPVVSIPTSAQPFFGVPFHLTCVSSIPPFGSSTSLQLEVAWNVTVREDGRLTVSSFQPLTFPAIPGVPVSANLSYTFLSEEAHTVTCSATVSGNTITERTVVTSTLLHALGELCMYTCDIHKEC
jgi:hypothetical protein